MNGWTDERRHVFGERADRIADRVCWLVVVIAFAYIASLYVEVFTNGAH